MWNQLAKIALPLALLVLLGFLVFLIGQTAQVAELAGRIHPALGQAVLWALLALYAALVLIPTVRFLRLPRSLKPPAHEDAPGFEEHLQELARRLQDNPRLKDRFPQIEGRDQVESALEALNSQAEEIVRSTASTVFLVTAISQSGRLDGLTVLVSQSRMVWRIALIYSQRPSLREIAQLYANVAASAFVAAELEDSEVGSQIGAILATSLGSAFGAIPGLQTAANLAAESTVTGSANAFFTLRVGLIAIGYCGSVLKPERRAVRRSATARAVTLLGAIASDRAAKVSSVVWEVSKDKAKRAAGSVRDRVLRRDRDGEDAHREEEPPGPPDAESAAEWDEETLRRRFMRKLGWVR